MILEAAEFAKKAHEGSVRKGTNIPYITHPLEVAVIVSQMTEEQEVIAAALLHDTMEDAGITYVQLESLFGSRVADLVSQESEDKSRTWLERKSYTLEHLKHAGREVKILTLGDKLSNLRTTARDYILIRDVVWDRFRVRDKELHRWYYTGMLPLLADLSGQPAYLEYQNLCSLVFGPNHVW